MGNLYKETQFIMKKYGIFANKKLGQNFLIDENVVDTIVEKSDVSKEDLVIEIGPGLGTLTARLLEKSGKVIAIELDERMIKILKDRFFVYHNLEILNTDVLKVDLRQIILENKNDKIKKVKIVANLPYYITTPIIMKLLEDKLDIESITVMVQKEVADRLTAVPGSKDAGAITYTVYYYTKPSKVLEVPNSSFIPAPDVDSEVIKLDVRKSSIVDLKNEEIFFKIIKVAFMQRRKTLVNALSNSDMFESKEQVEKILKELNIDIKVRGEALTIKQYAQIANFL